MLIGLVNLQDIVLEGICLDTDLVLELINLLSVGLGSIPTSLDSSCACSSTIAGFTNQRKASLDSSCACSSTIAGFTNQRKGLTLTERMLGFRKRSGRTKKRGIRKKEVAEQREREGIHELKAESCQSRKL